MIGFGDASYMMYAICKSTPHTLLGLGTHSKQGEAEDYCPRVRVAGEAQQHLAKG